MVTITPIEEKYRDLCDKVNPVYFHTYSVVKSRLTKDYLPCVRDVQPFMTDHGVGHVDRIFEKLYRFLEPHLPVSGNPDGRIIDLENLNLLMHSVLWHDIGNVYGRADHAKNIVKIFKNVGSFLYDSYHLDYIAKIAEGHSGSNSIEKSLKDASVIIHDSVIFPQFLSALLRISDEIDEDDRRATPIAVPTLPMFPKGSEAYWNFCRCTPSIVPIYQQDSLGNFKLMIIVNARIMGKDICNMWCKDSGKVQAIEEYVSRLDKINRERIYSNKFLEKNSKLYFRRIECVRAEVRICDDTGMAIDTMSFDFSDSTSVSDFFEDDDIKRTLGKHGFRR
jgi:hypothetical protein